MYPIDGRGNQRGREPTDINSMERRGESRKSVIFTDDSSREGSTQFMNRRLPPRIACSLASQRKRSTRLRRARSRLSTSQLPNMIDQLIAHNTYPQKVSNSENTSFYWCSSFFEGNVERELMRIKDIKEHAICHTCYTCNKATDCIALSLLEYRWSPPSLSGELCSQICGNSIQLEDKNA